MSASDITEEIVRVALSRVKTTDGMRDLVGAGLIAGISIRGGHVAFSIETPPDQVDRFETLRADAEKTVAAIPGVLSASAALTAHRPHQSPQQTKPPSSGRANDQITLPDVSAIIAVASGKGGVGKSTIATNLACALARIGARVGLMDADIYGPSCPRMMGLSGRPDSPDGKTITPMFGHGIACMSIGFLIDEDQPMIWRGPMVMGAIQQLLRNVSWGTLDVLVIDMPPGTGDAQLTISQQVALHGAVIVSTPQDIALLDAKKGIQMFRRVEAPILGLIENMSYFLCPGCGERTEIFAHGGAREAAERMGIPFLGEIPLDIIVRQQGDIGKPILFAEPDHAISHAFLRIAEQVRTSIDKPLRATPTIEIS